MIFSSEKENGSTGKIRFSKEIRIREKIKRFITFIFDFDKE